MQRIVQTFFCPDMKSQSSEIQIRTSLMNTPGVVDCEVSLSDRTVQVVLANPEGEASVRRHLSSVGFPPED